MLSGIGWCPSIPDEPDGLQIIKARLMKFLKTMGQILLITGVWCGSVLAALYLIERDRMRETGLLGSPDQPSQ
ncbi:hypothetical protein MITS9509_03192 [Synechococcus sp. MIT S9509]|nr:hypothetical protein MITS9504_03098 [Synechococcus sp. MIT S9504]KZR88866.1 hypothetical protein MITS9509_03192 [Synechococcus sp. MIT S9509]